MKDKMKLIEAVLFIKGEDGITLEDLSKIINKKQKDTKDLLDRYIALIQSDENRGFSIKKFGDVFKLVTKKELFDDLSTITINKNARLTQAALETMTIIAYKQPISKVDIERIRGVSAEYAVKKLLTFDLIEERGRTNSPGMPILYGTTQRFLDKFDMSSIEELPEFKKLIDEEAVTRELELFNYD